jgi:PAS domain S-box-containing protein
MMTRVNTQTRSKRQAMNQQNIQKKPMSDERRYQYLITGISDYAIYMLDPSGHVSSWNAGANRFKGYVAQEILGEHFSRFYTPEDQGNGLPARALAQALANGQYESEGWRVRKDGTRFWAHVVIDPIYNEEGLLLGFAKVTRDVTERKRAEDKLRDSEQRFRLLVQGVTDYAIYMLSPEGIVTNWNSGAERIKGYSHDEIVGNHFSKFYLPDDQGAGAPARALATAAEVGRFEAEAWRLRKDGPTS